MAADTRMSLKAVPSIRGAAQHPGNGIDGSVAYTAPDPAHPTGQRKAWRSPAPVRRSPLAPWLTVSRLVVILMMVATVSWRHKVYYAGGVDPVVAIKGLLSVAALGIALAAKARCRHPHRMGTRYVWFVLAFLAISTFGAWTTGSLVTNLVLSVRMLILAVTAILLVRTFATERIVRDLLATTLILGLLGAATGISSYIGGARLEGGIPPLNPNEISMLLSLSAIGLVWLGLNGQGRKLHGALLLVILGLIWATGSRTGLIALVVAVMVMLVAAKRIKPTFVFLIACAAPAVLYIALGTSLLAGYFDRGGANVTTLNSRSIAWSAAFTFPDTEWVRWMGGGLSLKEIPVAGQYWNQQTLDSSWISAMVQAGLLGALVLLIWALSAVVSAFRTPPPARMVFSGLLVFLIFRSVLESGLMDSTPAFIVFMVVSLLSDKGSRADLLTLTDSSEAVPSGAAVRMRPA